MRAPGIGRKMASVNARTIDGWQKRLGVAADKLLDGAERAESAAETQKKLDAFAHIVDAMAKLETCRRSPKG